MSDRSMLEPAAAELARAAHGDPFAVLGLQAGQHQPLSVRALLPGAAQVDVVDALGTRRIVALDRRGDDGWFVADVPRRRNRFVYRLRVRWADGTTQTIDDPYRFGPLIDDTDLWLLSEGTHMRPWQVLGAHVCTIENVAGVRFAVWAPNARDAAVVGDFNLWDRRRHPMRLRPQAGIWELFIPGALAGQRYKFALTGPDGATLDDHADPYARQAELRPATASIVAAPLAAAQVACSRTAIDAPIAIYELHAMSWRRVVEDGNRFLNWDELAAQLIAYVCDLGFTHIELMPVSEHPFDGSWGYQPIGLYAPTARLGAPEGLQRFVQQCHAAGLGVILDWVPGHFPEDRHGLACFDGTHLFEHADPREGRHQDWNTLIYNYGRREVANFLAGNARYWVEQFGIDGLRVDAVASMLYRDYSRAPGQWRPNQHGGRENIEAIEFLRRMNEQLGATHPMVATFAEESTAWPGVSKPTSVGGLGFHYKWNMGWMNDTLRYIARDPMHRRYHHDELTFGLVYAFDEQFVLPISHDEVVHGKGSLLSRMPGDRWQQFANVRLYLSFMYAHPGKKLLFMGTEFAQQREWNHDVSLDWHLLDDPAHRGVQALVRDLNRLYRGLGALHARDTRADGFEWLTHDEHETSVLAFVRRGTSDDAHLLVVLNFTPVPRRGYRLGTPCAGGYSEQLNSDSAYYGGSNFGNHGRMLRTEPIAVHGRAQSISIDLPPLAALFLKPEAAA